MRRPRIALTALAFLALFCLAPFGPSGNRPAPSTESATPPADTTTVWIRSTDHQAFYYSTSLGVWLGEQIEIPFIGVGTPTTASQLKYPANINSTSNSTGYWARGNLRLLKVICLTQTGATNCTTQVVCGPAGGAPDTVIKIPWNGPLTVATPSSDSSNAWVAPAAYVHCDSADVIAASLIEKSAGATNPNIPQSMTVWREEVAP